MSHIYDIMSNILMKITNILRLLTYKNNSISIILICNNMDYGTVSRVMTYEVVESRKSN